MNATTPAAHVPTLRQGALVTILGYFLTFGTPFASFSALPKLIDTTSAARTTENIQAHPRLLAAAILAMLANFIGDVLAAWGLYVLLRPVSAAWSMLVAWFRVVYTTAGLGALLELVTAYQLVTKPGSFAALGREALQAQVHASLLSYQARFDFSLIVFGLYLELLGWLMIRSQYIPRWLGIVLLVNGLGWMLLEAGPYLLPGVPLGFLFVTTFGELVLLVWLIGWGIRLREPVAHARMS